MKRGRLIFLGIVAASGLLYAIARPACPPREAASSFEIGRAVFFVGQNDDVQFLDIGGFMATEPRWEKFWNTTTITIPVCRSTPPYSALIGIGWRHDRKVKP